MSASEASAVDRRALIDRLVSGRLSLNSRDAPVRVDDRPEDLPLAPAQERIWFAHQAAGRSPLFTLVSLRSVRMPAEEFARRAREVVGRHAALRMNIVEREGRPVGRLRDAAGFDVAHLSLAHLDEAAARRELDAFVQAERGHCFDTAAEWPVRMTRVAMPVGTDVVVLAAHHLVGDGISVSILFSELLGKPVPPSPIDYPDYALWEDTPQRIRRRREQVRRQAAALAGAPFPVRVPPDFRGAEDDHGMGVERIAIPEALAERVRGRARAAGCTEPVFLLAGWLSVLARTTGQRDLVIGMPVTGRDRAELVGLIGPFANVLPLRVRLPFRGGFADVLQHCRRAVADALRHQDAPVNDVLAAVYGSPTVLGSTLGVLFNTFRVQPDMPEFPLPGLAEHPLALEVFDDGVRLRSRLVYQSARYAAATVRSLGEGFVQTLEAACAEAPGPATAGGAAGPGHRPGGAAVPTAEPAPEEVPGGILAAIEAGMADSGHTAVESADGRLGYGDLLARARSLAARLREAGAGGGMPVAVTVSRGPRAVVALLGVLAAGASYLPLPADVPERRRQAVLAAAAPAVAVVDAPEPGGLAVRGLDAAGAAPDPAPGWPAEGGYCVFTSGSTGRPNGVVVAAGTLLRHLARTRAELELTPADRCLQFSGHGFDAWIEQALAPLLAGAAVVMRGEETWDPLAFGTLARRTRLTVANLPTPWFNALSAASAEQWRELADSPLRLVMPGGDEIAPAAVAEWHRRMPADVMLVNAYGPTEAVVTATLGRLRPEPDAAPRARHPIGRVTAGRRGQVCDGALRPCAAGEVGELWLGGVLADGYLGDPRRTALAFVPDPFGPPGRRMYRTGDLVRPAGSGELEFLGRADSQVKVMGLRFEPGEVEKALTAHPAVAEAVVVPHEGADRHLVAWIVGRHPVSPAELREFVAARLPAAVVPRRIEVRERLPRTDGGKADRGLLRRWSASDAPAQEAGGDLAHPVRAQLAAWFTELLGTPARDSGDFFQLGGNSLLAVRLAARCRETFGADVDLGTVFAHPTVAALADRIGRAGTANAVGAVRPRPPRTGARHPLSAAQRGFWFGYRNSEPTAYMVPVAVRCRGPLDAGALASALTDVVSRHETLRLAVHDGGGGLNGEVRPVAREEVERELRPVACADDDTLNAAVDELARTPIDLRSGPLRVALLRRAADDHVLFLALHHIACDGQSVGVVVRELLARYTAHSVGDTAPPAAAVQYADVADGLAAEAGERAGGDAAYWRRRLAGVEPLAFPADRAEREAPAGATAGDVLVGESTGRALRRLARTHSVTPFAVALGAWQLALARWSGQDDFAIGVPMSRRGHTSHSEVVGPLLNMVAVRATPVRGTAVRGFLREVQRSLVDAFEHRRMPFAEVVAALGVDRGADRSPVFQTMVTPQEVSGGLEAAGLRLTWWQLPPDAPQLPLALYLVEDGDGLAPVIRYDRTALDASAVRRLTRILTRLVEEGLDDADRAVTGIDPVPDDELNRVLAAGRGPEPEPADAPVGERIRRWAELRPDAVAVRDASRVLTYARLDAEVAAAATELRRAGVGRSDRVGVCLTRGAGLVVAFLAALRIGAAYVPLDPDHPAERLRAMADIAGPVVTVVEQATAHVAPLVGTVLRLPADPGARTGAPPPETAVHPGEAAYLIFTSGSTGRPKGVVVEHRALGWLMDALTAATSWTPGDVLVTTCRPVFDVSVMELLLPLVCGATVVLHEPGGAFDPHELAASVQRAGTTKLYATPTVWAQLRDTAVDLAGRHGMSAGEPLTGDLARALMGRGLRLWNGYGPTETTVVVTGSYLETSDLDLPVVALGDPLPGVHLYVLDRWLRPVPLGAAGEVYVSGDCLARGYHAAPARTAARFVPDPRRPGERMYRTGDRARRLDDGRLRFLGRTDHQVKLNGHRIELGEVTAAAAAHPAVRTAATVLDRSGPHGDRLVTFVEPAEQGLDATEVRRWTARRLPAYMVPVVRVVAALPLSAGGKVDLRALHELVPPETGAEGGPLDPRDNLERLVAAVWAEVLRVDAVARNRSFFDLGGESITAIRVAGRLGELFGVELPVSLLFAAQTVQELAGALRDRLGARADEVADAAAAILQDAS
ncbi:non-ribosomal peptide synthetase [Allonocardiopsis opalescens]|uniref:Amino acid adenylation domain-containing protein n=1 Tax=Allonocardiopsis opalescens TaxID=1144618 RepID=A0A2T0PYN2_9ACTN|nr:non-ribosomal peptide synthetase [Allonocardiopsis opalescens]PRX96569.1 amino acid adenylation domain-containing protein [Allonocardiopsis opalescens]